MAKMLYMLLEARATAQPGSVLAGSINWRVGLTAKALMAKVIRDLPVDDFSAQLNALRETI